MVWYKTMLKMRMTAILTFCSALSELITSYPLRMIILDNQFQKKTVREFTIYLLMSNQGKLWSIQKKNKEVFVFFLKLQLMQSICQKNVLQSFAPYVTFHLIWGMFFFHAIISSSPFQISVFSNTCFWIFLKHVNFHQFLFDINQGVIWKA